MTTYRCRTTLNNQIGAILSFPCDFNKNMKAIFSLLWRHSEVARHRTTKQVLFLKFLYHFTPISLLLKQKYEIDIFMIMPSKRRRATSHDIARQNKFDFWISRVSLPPKRYFLSRNKGFTFQRKWGHSDVAGQNKADFRFQRPKLPLIPDFQRNRRNFIFLDIFFLLGHKLGQRPGKG